jgi:hypothetical protein
MNPALPKTRILTIKGKGKSYKAMQRRFSKVKIGLNITMKGRAG